jgi:ABC-type branched-subunit amino acid transport system substrate-binding protein
MRTFATCGICVVAMAAAIGAAGCKKNTRSSTEETKPATPEANAIPGVTAEEITIGMTGPFTGFNAQYSTETWRGMQAYLLEVNSNGGVHGRKFKVLGVNDDYNADRQLENLAAFAQNKSVFIVQSVGTAHFTKAVDNIMKYHKEQDFLIWSPYSGAQVTRTAPANDATFAIRPSYFAEEQALVDAMVAGGHKKIGTLITDDAFGRDGLAGIRKAVESHGLKIVLETTHVTGQKFDVSLSQQVQALKAAGVDAVVCSTNYQPAAAFVRDARAINWHVPIGQNSHAGDTYLRRLKQYENDTNRQVSDRLVSTATVPRHDDTSLPAVAEYRSLMAKRNPRPPPELQDANYKINEYGQTSLEGFIQAKILVEVFRRAGPQLTRKRFVEAAETLKDYDPGVGATVSFGPSDHQGFEKAWASIVKDGNWAPLPADMKAFFDAPEPPTAVAKGSKKEGK